MGPTPDRLQGQCLEYIVILDLVWERSADGFHSSKTAYGSISFMQDCLRLDFRPKQCLPEFKDPPSIVTSFYGPEFNKKKPFFNYIIAPEAQENLLPPVQVFFKELLYPNLGAYGSNSRQATGAMPGIYSNIGLSLRTLCGWLSFIQDCLRLNFIHARLPTARFQAKTTSACI